MAMGLFPNGTGPPGFPNQPVAVQTEQASLDFLGIPFYSGCNRKRGRER